VRSIENALVKLPDSRAGRGGFLPFGSPRIELCKERSAWAVALFVQRMVVLNITFKIVSNTLFNRGQNFFETLLGCV